MQNILFVLEIAAIFFLMSKGCISVLLWVMSLILFQMSYEKGNEHIYLEAIEDYPVQDCVKPKKFRFLYKKLNKLSYKGIPKEMYYCETIKCIWIYHLFYIGFCNAFYRYTDDILAWRSLYHTLCRIKSFECRYIEKKKFYCQI